MSPNKGNRVVNAGEKLAMHFEIASAKRRRSRGRWAFKDSRGTEFSFKRMRSTPRKARQLVAPRRSRERQSAKFHGGCKNLVTVIPRDANRKLCRTIRESGHPNRFDSRLREAASLYRLCASSMPSRSSIRDIYPLRVQRGRGKIPSSKNWNRTRLRWISISLAKMLYCILYTSIVSQAASSPHSGYSNIQKMSYIRAWKSIEDRDSIGHFTNGKMIKRMKRILSFSFLLSFSLLRFWETLCVSLQIKLHRIRKAFVES